MAERLTSIEPLKPLLKAGRLGLFTDIDGTLAAIVENPDEARVSPRNQEMLRELIEGGVRVVAVTGRTLERARQMTGVEGLAYAANHGMTVSVDGRDETTEEVTRYVALAGRAAEELRAALPGFMVEHTGPNVAIHYRTVSDVESARNAIADAVSGSPWAREFRVREGRKVFELRPPLAINKGTALVALARRLKVGSVLALGDDATDIDMFKSARSLSADGLRATSAAVRSEEMGLDVMEAADYWVDGVEGVEWLLGEVLKAVRSP